MTEEERFQRIYNIYMNYEAELASRGMEDIPPIAASLTQAYIIHEMKDLMVDNNTSITVTGDEISPIEAVRPVFQDEEWDSQP